VDRSLTESLKGVPVRIRDVTADARVQYPVEAQAEGIASMLSVPMFLKDNVIGVLRLYSESTSDFPEEEVEFASALAELGAIALENARLYSGLREQHESLMGDFTTWFETGRGADARGGSLESEREECLKGVLGVRSHYLTSSEPDSGQCRVIGVVG